jgi:hypothetical protein
MVGFKPTWPDGGIRWTLFLTKAAAQLLSGIADFYNKQPRF